MHHRRLPLAIITLLTVLFVSEQAHAVKPHLGKRFGLGVMIGNPTALSGKYWVNHTQAVDFNLGARHLLNSDSADPVFFADYLFHFNVGVVTPAFNMPLYFGPGLMLGALNSRHGCRIVGCYGGNPVYLGARLPLGISFLFKKFNAEAFIESALELILVPGTALDLDYAVGFRFYI